MARIAGIAGKRRVRPQTLLRELAEACREAQRVLRCAASDLDIAGASLRLEVK